MIERVRLVRMLRTDLRCRAPHPDARYAGRIHGSFLFTLPIEVRPTGQVVRSEELVDSEAGRIAAWCSRCGVYTEYEIVEAN